MNYVSTVKELETKYKVKKGKAKRYLVNKENIPAKFWMLLPYLEYFCIDSQEEREVFCEKLPEEAFNDLDEVLMSLESEPGLVSWLGGAEAKKKKLTDEYLALTILVEVRDNNISYDDDSPTELTDAEKERVNYVLKLSESELRNVWKIQPDSFQRIDFDASKLPAELQQLKAILNIVAIPKMRELEAFEEQNSGLAKQDIFLVKRMFHKEINDYSSEAGSKAMINRTELEKHEEAVDMLRIIFE